VGTSDWLRPQSQLDSPFSNFQQLLPEELLVAGARYVPNRQFLSIPFRSELIHCPRKCGLRTQRLNCNVHTFTAGHPPDFFDRVRPDMVNDNVRPHWFCHGRAYRIGFHGDDESRASQPGAGRCTQPDWPLSKHRHGVAQLHASAFGRPR